MRPHRRFRPGLPTACSLLAALFALAAGATDSPSPEPQSPDPQAIWQQIEETTLDTSRAINVSGLKLQAGLAHLDVEQGVAYLATPVGGPADGQPREIVFQGRAVLTLEPPDEIEAGQLELFTGERRLEETVTEGIWVLASDPAVEAIARRPAVEVLGGDKARRAEDLLRRWVAQPERRLLGIDGAIFRDALGDPFYASYFAGWFQGEERGEFLYFYEPDSMEQSTLGQFVPFELTEKEERKLSRQIHKAQRKGRMIGLSAADLGAWDTWVSASHRSADGSVAPGFRPFEPKHYELDVTLTGSKLDFSGVARLHLEALTDLGRIVRLSLFSDLQVRDVSLEGAKIFFHQSGGEILVVLPEAPAQGETVVLEIRYDGVMVEKVESKTYVLRDTLSWYPHAGIVDLATYDVTLRWPGKRDLVAPGRVVEQREEGDQRFVRRRVDRPTLGFSFEIGDYKTFTAKAGHVEVTLAVGALTRQLLEKKEREKVLASVADALTYFEETFGPYPLDELTVVTAPRGVSQSLLGYITLSSVMMIDDGFFSVLLGFEDRRTVIAHEVAHQWWGHQIGWMSYRDQWISEAMANYSAALYARNRLKSPPRVGPYTGWQRALTRTIDDGRRIESLGPLVLGERLVSSLSGGDAYHAIVYKKGAVVLEMLSQTFQEKTFVRVLQSMLKAVQFQPISTETFLDLIERITHSPLDDFAQRFIFGTGLPEFYYTYEFVPQDDGSWVVEGVARQVSPYHYRYFVTETETSPDVRRERIDQIDVDDSFVVVPVELYAYDPKVGRTHYHDTNKLDPEEVGNVSMSARVVLRGASSEFRFQMANEPKELWLDRKNDVFGRFFNERRFPKRMLYYQGLERSGAGDYEAAAETFERALEAPAFSGPVIQRGGKMDEDALEDETRSLDFRTHLQLTRLHLDRGDVAAARESFDRAEDLKTSWLRQSHNRTLTNLEARLALREGDPKQAYKLLRKQVLKREKLQNAESALLLAVAAKALGEVEEYEEALEIAREAGADVDEL